MADRGPAIAADPLQDFPPGGFMWGKLLRTIRYEHVIPIIGPELLPYHQELAPALAKTLDVDPAYAAAGIGAVADAAGGDGREATEALSLLLDRHSAPVPAALSELASIDEFRLIFTTDYTSLVERAYRARGAACDTRGFALRRRADAIHAHPEDGERCVYHLLGHLERFGAIALPRARQLEYLYNLTMARSALLDVLSDCSNLLFLGCNFPEWIAGLFTRMLLGKPLYEWRDSIEVVACSALNAGQAPSFTGFLKDHQVEIYPGDAAEFVNELARRYRAAFPTDGPSGRGSGEPYGDLAGFGAPDGDLDQPATGVHARLSRKGHTFISYCSADAPAAKLLARELTSEGVSVWLDERDVTPGTPVDDAIRVAIQEDSAAFIAVVSRRVFQTDRSYFLREWRYALDAQRSMATHVPFAFPVVVDDLGVSDAVARLRKFFPAWAEANVEHCPSGRVTAALLTALKEARKRFERRRVHDYRRA